MSGVIDLTGQRFGELTVISREPTRISGRGRRTMWLCKCDCGKMTVVDAVSLRRKKDGTKTCGKHKSKSDIQAHTKHGLSKTRIYREWCCVKNRCKNKASKDYPRYGGRGIKVCEDWDKNFTSFYDWSMANGYSDDLTIDRIDNDKGYSPDNCRWVGREVQVLNTRKNHYLTLNGRTQTMTEWCRELGINKNTLRTRVSRLNWSDEKALTTPVKNNESKKGVV